MEIPRELMASAYSSQGGEAAWSKEDALNVIRWATSSEIAVFGVEVWLPTTPGPTIPMPFVYTFGWEPYKNETWLAFVKRANVGSVEYVDEFEWDPEDVQHHGMEPFFNLTLDRGKLGGRS